MASGTRQRHSLLTEVALVVALLGVVASAALNWVFAGLVFFGESLRRDDYHTMSLGFALAAGLLLLGLLPVRAAGARAWVVVVALGLAALCGLLAVATRAEMAGAPPAEYADPWAAVQVMAWLPTSWPLLVLIVVSPWLRGRSSPPPRPLLDR